MKKLNRKLMMIIGIMTITLISISCNTPEDDAIIDDGLPYYQFTQEERNHLINKPNINDEFIYKNQDNELIKFKVYNSRKEKATYSTGTFFGGSSPHFHYDRQEISMWHLEGYISSSCEINIQKYPVGSNYQTSPPVIGTPRFYGYFDFPFWNGYSETAVYNKTIYFIFETPTTSMAFNGKIYTKVRKFESDKTEVLNPTSPYPRNVNVIYYDYNFGIIGFDDLNGKLWRLQ